MEVYVLTKFHSKFIRTQNISFHIRVFSQSKLTQLMVRDRKQMGTPVLKKLPFRIRNVQSIKGKPIIVFYTKWF